MKGGVLVAEKKAKEQKGDAKNVAAKKDTKKFMSRVSKSVTDMKSEIKKIVWPSKKTVINNTLVVIAVMAISAIVVGGLDTVLMTLVNLLLRNA